MTPDNPAPSSVPPSAPEPAGTPHVATQVPTHVTSSSAQDAAQVVAQVVAHDTEPDAAHATPEVSLWALFKCFIQVGVSSFGGSTQSWIFRAVVDERRWLSEEAFLAGVTVAQILPGANPVNLSLYVGQRLRGALGALIATLGMVVPAICIVLVAGAVYARLARYPLTHFLLIGIATVGIGATLAVGAKGALKAERSVISIGLGLATFIAVGIFHWSMIPVVLVLAPLSVFLAARRPRG